MRGEGGWWVSIAPPPSFTRGGWWKGGGGILYWRVTALPHPLVGGMLERDTNLPLWCLPRTLWEGGDLNMLPGEGLPGQSGRLLTDPPLPHTQRKPAGGGDAHHGTPPVSA